MSRFGLAPATIYSMLRRRTRSSGSPVKTCTCQGWVFMDDGARLAISMISSITARGTGSALKPRTLRRVFTRVSKSIFSILRGEQSWGSRRPLHQQRGDAAGTIAHREHPRARLAAGADIGHIDA